MDEKNFIVGCNGCSSCATGFGLCTYLDQIFDSLNPQEQLMLIKKAHHRNFNSGELVFSGEDIANRITIFRQGEVKLNHFTSDGKEFVLDTLRAGDIYGEQSLFSDEKYNFNCIAIEETKICELYCEDIQEVMFKNPNVGAKLLKILGKKYSNISKLMEINSLNDAKQRLSGFLLYRMNRYDEQIIRLSRDEIASSINLRTETVSRKLTELKNDRIILLKGQKYIEILDKDKLWDEYQKI